MLRLRRSGGWMRAIDNPHADRFCNIPAPLESIFLSPVDLRRIVGRHAWMRSRLRFYFLVHLFVFIKVTGDCPAGRPCFSPLIGVPLTISARFPTVPLHLFLSAPRAIGRALWYLLFAFHTTYDYHPRNHPTVGISKSTASTMTMNTTSDDRL